MQGDVLLVGSIPGDCARDAMKNCADGIGTYLSCLPDGETGKRRIWINFLAATVYDQNPNIDTLNSPVPVEVGHPEEWRADGEDWAPRGYEDHWQFKLRDHAEELIFPSLGYADAAAESYKTFCSLREAGDIPKHVRFMVAIPLVESAVRIFFSNGDDYPIVRSAYEKALVSEIEKLLEVIPAEDLAIQWDICMEILAVELNDEQPGLFPWKAPGDPFERFLQSLKHASALIPAQTLLGCHLCYGDLGHKHVIEPKDLSVVVQFANEARKQMPRVIDFFHMPVPKDRVDTAYFKPLESLDVGEGKLFLGLIHHTDGVGGAKQRIEQANRFIRNYGIATECGFGRRPVEQIPDLLAIHAEAVTLLS